MPRNWSIPRTSYDALGKLNIQRSPAIDKAIWESRADPAKLIRAMQARMTEALNANQDTTKIGDGGSKALSEKQGTVLHQKPVTGSKLVHGDEYVRVSVSYPRKTEEAVEYLSKLLKLSYEETVRLSLEAYIKHL